MNTNQDVADTLKLLQELTGQLEEAYERFDEGRITSTLGQIHLVAEQGLISWHIQKNKD